VPVPPSILFLVTGMMGLVLKRNNEVTTA